MTEIDHERTQEEIDKLLNDPETPMHAERIWALLEALASATRGHFAGERGSAG
jgi:hypothetical protein